MAKKTNYEKNGNKYYRVTVTVGKNPDGTPIRKEFYGKSKSEAEEKRDEYLKGIDAGLNVDYKEMVLGNLMHIWLYEVRLPSKNSPATFARYENVYRNHIKNSELYNLKLDQITKLTLQRFYNRQIAAGKTPGNIRDINKILKIFFNYAVDNDFILKNPCIRIELPVDNDEPDEEAIETPLTSDEIDKLKTVLKGNRIEFLFLLSLGTGIRQGELLALTNADADLEKGELNINKNLTRDKVVKKDGSSEYKLFIGPPKTKSSKRVVQIPDSLIPLFHKYIITQKEKYLKNGIPFKDDSPLFTTDSCSYIERRNLLRAWQRASKRADIPYRSWHCIRHTYATKLFEANVPLKTVQTLLGHSNINMTAQIYTHVMPKQKDTAANALNFMFF